MEARSPAQKLYGTKAGDTVRGTGQSGATAKQSTRAAEARPRVARRGAPEQSGTAGQSGVARHGRARRTRGAERGEARQGEVSRFSKHKTLAPIVE
jgi:hypothetical protein